MTQPSILPVGYAGDYTDYLKTKEDRSGAVRRIQGVVALPAATATNTIIGLFPFNEGMSFSGLGGFNVHSDDLDSSTNVTMNVGIVYQDTVNGTDALALITSASTAPQAGGFIAPTATDWMQEITTGNGWVTVQVLAATTTTGNVIFNIPFAYDQVTTLG